MKMQLIAAIDENLGTGFNDRLPWPEILEDLRHFRRETLYGTVVMGRRTWESIGGKPLDRRLNLILTKTMPTPAPDKPFFVVRTIMEALNYCVGEHASFIGGTEVWKTFAPFCPELLLTKVKGTFEADTFFPASVLATYPYEDIIQETDKCIITRRTRI